ncbi:MAG TPA: hypothetical protein VE093_05095 [Polyangiaceae bacterium]|jgi:hypothetical protein|nr:hypothetical protein [Polyangiaceae bacterium]
MTEGAEKALRDLRDKYKKAGFPPEGQWAFRPNPDQKAAFQELHARGYIKRFTSRDWNLTEEGLEWIMDDIGPMSAEAELIIESLRKAYVANKFPPRRQIGFSPESGEQTAYRELRARGYLEKNTARDYCFTERGVQWALGDGV